MSRNTRQPLDPSTANSQPAAWPSQAQAPSPPPAPWLIPDPNASLTRPQAATFLGISPAFLKKMDLEGRGPAAYRIGRRWTYQKADLLAWREAFRTEGLLATLPHLVPAQIDPVALPPPFPADPVPPPRRRGRPPRRPVEETDREVA